MVTPTFITVDGSDYNLDNLEVLNVEDGEASIQMMDKDGHWVGTYTWFNEWVNPDDPTDIAPAGWVDEGYAPAGTIEPGLAVYYFCENKNAKIQSSGQVPTGYTVPLPQGSSMVGNGTPLPIDADTMVVNGAEDGQVSMQRMDEDGHWIGTYTWFNEWVNPDDPTDIAPAGWVDEGYAPAGIIEAGDAAYIFSNAEAATITMPSAIK